MYCIYIYISFTLTLLFLLLSVAFDLPFPDNFFDYVRMANLVLCIPYDKWDYVFKEVRRVLAVNGKMELIDDQILFPYGIAPKQPPWPRDMSDAFHDAFSEETLQGSESDTESTLNANSEPSNSSFEDQIFDSPIRRIASYQPPTPTWLSSCQSSGSTLDDAHSRYVSWHNQATASRELESIFVIMLQQKYKIVPRPSDFILKRMSAVFGSEAAGKTKSFHIKLAPSDSADSGQGKADGEETKEKTLKKKERKKPTNSTASSNSSGSGTSSVRSSLENSASVSSPSSPAPTNIKAAGRLGISFGSPLKETVSSPPPPLQLDQTQAILSAKAAGRLGISYSDLAAATIASTHQLPGAPPPSLSPLQSPGLLVWPSIFIPLTPVEVEMHANKYVHTLLGCKPALAEFIAQFRDENGARFVDDDEFHEVMWKYEWYGFFLLLQLFINTKAPLNLI